MSEAPIKVAIIGLDTSHSVELPKLMADSTIAPEFRVPGMIPTRALRFETPFQKKEGLDKRQAYLESIGVKVTEDFDTAVADCDAILLVINDGSFHREYFEKCAALGKPIFMDKPFADTLENARMIRDIAAKNNTRYFTCSSLRFCPGITAARQAMPAPTEALVWGPLGNAPAGSSIVWYGVHAVEMLESILGKGAISVQLCEHGKGCFLNLNYADGRRGVISLDRSSYQYGGLLRDGAATPVKFDEIITTHFYRPMLVEIEKFFRGGEAPVAIEDSYEIMAILDAAEKSLHTRQPQAIYTF